MFVLLWDMALREHLDEDEKKSVSELGPISGPNYHEGKAVFISESGLHSLISLLALFRIFILS